MEMFFIRQLEHDDPVVFILYEDIGLQFTDWKCGYAFKKLVSDLSEG
jgi:hypothetical protein